MESTDSLDPLVCHWPKVAAVAWAICALSSLACFLYTATAPYRISPAQVLSLELATWIAMGSSATGVACGGAILVAQIQRKPKNSSRLTLWSMVFVLYLALAIGLVFGLGGQEHAINREQVPPPSREPSAQTSCAANLAEIQGAKVEWSKERHRSTGEIPTISDLVGATNYLQRWPKCPDGGTYNIRRVKELPECSLREHVYPGQPLPSQ